MQSININSLISSETYKIKSATPELPNLSGIKNLFLEVLDKTGESVLVTNINAQQSVIFYIELGEPVIILREKKDAKKREFRFAFDTSFLTYNQRRAGVDEFKAFSDRLRLIGGYVLKHSPVMLALSEAGPSVPAQVLDLLKRELGFSKTGFKELHLTDELRSQLVSDLSRFSKLMAPISADAPASSVKVENLATEMNQVKEWFLGMLSENYKKILITNVGVSKDRQASSYVLLISPQKVTFMEKSQVAKNKCEISLEDGEATFNQGPFNLSMLKWFLSKVKIVSQHLLQKKATILKESS